MLLTDFCGNETAKKSLAYYIESKQFPHAFLIEGESGLGKATFAKLIYASMVCAGKDKPCGACSSCRKIMGDIHPDFIVLKGKGTPNSFHIDLIRALKKELYLVPNDSEKKLYLIKDADTMTIQAQNAMLKILEEPPEFAVFVLTCKNKSLLLETILSRTTHIKLAPVSKKDQKEYLCRRFPHVPPEKIEEAVVLSGGNIKESINFLNGEEGHTALIAVDRITSALISKNEYDLLAALSPLCKDKELCSLVFAMLIATFRDTIALKYSKKEALIIPSRKNSSELSKKLSSGALLSMITAVENAKIKLNKNVNQNLLITALCGELSSAVPV